MIHRRVTDEAGLGDHGCDVRHAGGDVRAPDGARHHADCVHSVLKRNDDRIGADERREKRCSRNDIIELDRKEDRIDGADGRRVVGRVHAVNVEIALGTLEAQAARPQSLEMTAARDEGDVRSRRREPAAEVAADRARADDRDAHGPAIVAR